MRREKILSLLHQKNNNMDIPHYGSIREDEASSFIQQMLEYTTLRDAHAQFICSHPSEPIPEREQEICAFYDERIKMADAILGDFMVRRCRELGRSVGRCGKTG